MGANTKNCQSPQDDETSAGGRRAAHACTSEECRALQTRHAQAVAEYRALEKRYLADRKKMHALEEAAEDRARLVAHIEALQSAIAAQQLRGAHDNAWLAEHLGQDMRIALEPFAYPTVRKKMMLFWPEMRRIYCTDTVYRRLLAVEDCTEQTELLSLFSFDRCLLARMLPHALRRHALFQSPRYTHAVSRILAEKDAWDVALSRYTRQDLRVYLENTAECAETMRAAYAMSACTKTLKALVALGMLPVLLSRHRVCAEYRAHTAARVLVCGGRRVSRELRAAAEAAVCARREAVRAVHGEVPAGMSPPAEQCALHLRSI